MARGADAKNEVIKKIQAAFGADYIGEVDKKIYVQVPEGGEMVQIAIALTCPKNPVAVSNAPVVRNGGIDFTSGVTITPPAATTEISDDERKTVADMMARFGL